MLLPIVFLHGFLGDADSFGVVLSWMKTERPSYCPPLYGHSGRDESLLEHDFDAEVIRLSELIQARFESTRVHLVGYSMGARLALGLLSNAPSLFQSATLISSRSGLLDAESRAARYREDGQWAEMLDTLPLNDFLDIWESRPLFESLRNLPTTMAMQLREQRLKHHPKALARAMTALSLAKMPDLSREISKIQCPVLLLVGEKDRKFVQLAAEVAAHVPNCRTIVVSGAGHNLPLERPEEVAAAISEELKYAER